MKLNPIVTSLLETDLYKFSMGQAIYHQFSDYKTTWTFKCRNKDVHFTKEMLEEVAPEVTLDPAILHQLQEGQTVRSPGMKYQHYSPRAHVILVEGSWQNFAALAEQNRADGVYALVFDGEETMLSLPCLTYGRSGREQAQQIFSKLRELDDDGAQKVYVRAPKPEGIGLAVYNRLIRAAGFEVIQV